VYLSSYIVFGMFCVAAYMA